MAEDKKKKLGLQKNVSWIFKGVPIPQKNAGDNVEQSPNTPAPGRKRNIPTLERTTGSIPEPQHKGDISTPERNVNTPEPEHNVDVPTPEHTSNIPAKPKFQESQKSQISLIKKINQPTQLLRKDTPVKQLVVDTNKKVTKTSQPQRARNKFFALKPGKDSARQKVAVAMIPVLAFVFIFVLRQVFWTAPHKTEGAVEKDTPSVTATVADSSNEINWEIPALYPRSLRDPMKLKSTGSKQTGSEESGKIIELNVNGILHSEDNPAVLIGDRIAHEGEIISGVTIIKINKDSVELEMNGKKWERKVLR